jgi:dsRNA-specific ribonuclease|tara:strand:+ start:2111 stop:2935 length:825 start_codon:yes stop_codon:yes gene_type:complete
MGDETSHASSPPSLETWRRVLRDVPLARILPRDSDFGAGVDIATSSMRHGETAERLAFFGDKLLTQSIASALYSKHGLSMSTGDMSTTAARAMSNHLFAKLLPDLLRQDMVNATPKGREILERKHSAGTMVEACVFLVAAEFGGDDADAAIAEVGAFLLHSASAAGAHVADVGNHKGTLLELTQKGVPGTLLSTRVGPEGIDREFEATAELDGARATAMARTKKGAEQAASRKVFQALIQGQGRSHLGGAWSGTADAPVAPPQAYAPHVTEGSF